MEYGIEIGTMEGFDSEVGMASLGDGKTRVQAFYLDDGTAGVAIVNEKIDVLPFFKKNPENVQDNALFVDEDKIVIRADNRRSLQVVINSLTEAMEFLPE